ncbi:MAG: ABC transporter substrate-binding protein [Oscillospiraceae bacterium]|nr:ABC transporter substrate-binding protein [Oscillospiraceae bacterium]
MKKIIALLLAAIMMFAFAGCSENKNKEDSVLKIGIIQYMSHPSLDNCYNGIISALENSGIEYTVDYQTGSSSSADADCTNFAKNMVAANYDMIIAIATPAAKAAFAATDDTEIPVIFCAVSDPIAAGLVESMEAPGYICTGTSDVLDLEAQVAIIKAMQPDVKSIGILYTSSEDNSITNLKNFKSVCDKENIEVVATAVQGASDIPSAAEELASKVDCINNFTDNNVVNNLSVVLSAADKYGIPVYGSEEEQVVNGCLASVSIDYVALGKVTGEMAVEVLNGADASAMPVKTITEATPIINSSVLKKLGLSIPEGYSEVKTIE